VRNAIPGNAHGAPRRQPRRRAERARRAHLSKWSAHHRRSTPDARLKFHAEAVGINHIAVEVGDIDEALAWSRASSASSSCAGRSRSMAFVDLGDQFIALSPARRGAARAGTSAWCRRPEATRPPGAGRRALRRRNDLADPRGTSGRSWHRDVQSRRTARPRRNGLEAREVGAGARGAARKASPKDIGPRAGYRWPLAEESFTRREVRTGATVRRTDSSRFGPSDESRRGKRASPGKSRTTPKTRAHPRGRLASVHAGSPRSPCGRLELGHVHREQFVSPPAVYAGLDDEDPVDSQSARSPRRPS